MPWFKIDDKHHDHRKTRKALRGVPGKRRDASAMGLWELAGSWCADNLTDGFVPTDELYRWDDDAEALATRLVAAELWAPEEVAGEVGFRFVNWPEHQPMKEDVEKKREAARERMREVRATPSGSRRVRANAHGTSGEVGSTPSLPGPSAAAAAKGAAAAALPGRLAILQSKLQAHTPLRGLRFDTLTADQVDRLSVLVDIHGDDPLVTVAIATCRNPAPTYVTAFLGTWEALPAPGQRLHVVRPRFCPEHPYLQVTASGVCSSCAADSHAIPKENR